MSNFLEMRCPKCGDENSLDIAATVWIRVCEDGTDADASRDGSHDYEPHSPARCGACGHCGTVREFELAGSATSASSKPVFIHLLHGRDDPAEDMSDWGYTGPVLGPFEAVHFTYKEHIRCIRDAATGDEIELSFHGDLLAHDGKFYGDFEICGGHGS